MICIKATNKIIMIKIKRIFFDNILILKLIIVIRYYEENNFE